MNDTQIILPQGWVFTTIGEISDNVASVNPKEKPTIEFDYLDIASIDNRLQKITTPKRYVGKDAPSRARQLILTGDILFSTVRTYLKNFALVDSRYNEQIASTGFCVIRGLHDIDNKYVFYFVQTNQFLNPLNELQRGTSYPAVRDSDVFIQSIPLPPLPEQHRIVTKIEELFTQLDAGVASLKKAQAQLKRYRQAVLKAAFEGRLTQEWRKEHKGEIEPADVLFKKIKSDHPGDEKEIGKRLPLEISEMFKIPNDWLWVQAQDVCENISNGYTPTADKLFQDSGEIPFIKVYNLTKTGAFDFTIKPTFIRRETHETELRRSAVYPDDVLMSIVGPPMGKTSLVSDLYPEWNINQAIVIYRTFPEYSRKLILYVLLSETIQKWLQKRGKTTAGQTNYTITMSRSLPVPLPPLDEQSRIVEEIERHFSQIDHLENTIETSLRQSESLRQSILKRAFEGKLVPQYPNDEPASVLLERIKAGKALQQTKAKSPKTPKRKSKHAR